MLFLKSLNISGIIIFDRTPEKKWEEKTFRKSGKYEGKTIEVWGM
jgi:hypothetical protein